MRIGIDIDGVISDQARFCLECGKQFCDKYHISCVPDQASYEIQDMFHWDELTYRRFQQEYYPVFFQTDQYIRPCAKQVIQYLHKKHQIYVITARKPTLPARLGSLCTVEAVTEKWLKKAGICYDYFFCVSEVQEKWAVLTRQRIDLMIEDSPAFLSQSSLYPPIITVCFDAAYNRCFPGAEAILRIHTWREASGLINNLERGVCS